MAAAQPPLAAVIARMNEIDGSLPRNDGVACFTRLYLQVTEGVQQELRGVTFQDPVFLDRLDIRFADLFFAAFTDPPHAWAPLFAERAAKHIAPLQFALAGMSAHINRDLPVALVTTCKALEIEPVEGTPQHADYETVNTVLARIETQVKAQYLTGWLRTVDRLIHRVDRLDDVVAMWDVRRARDAAWVNAETMWGLRDVPELGKSYLLALDRMVGLTARGLLVPAETWLQRLARLT